LNFDTSAPVALSKEEPGREAIRDALVSEAATIPAPVVVEFRRVTAMASNLMNPDATLLLQQLQEAGSKTEPFKENDAEIAAISNEKFGTGTGRGARLNMLDLTVYSVARRTGRPIRCTGKNLQSTDAAIHPAGRDW